ncbi:MAG: PHP domain-containing protein [Clostridia bacterium]|nr:PHP domain-containing protein [Clostridia bacterium]
MKPDFHMHTTASDGVLSPRELVDFAVSRGVTMMAITDHDTFDGVDSLRGMDLPIPVITGVELSIADMKGLHLLGYGLTEAQELRGIVRELARKRLNRAQRMVEKLCEMGFELDYEGIRANCKGTVGRLHIARAMVEKAYVRNTEQAFDRYIGDDCPAYVPNERLTMAEALPLLLRNGFVPVLAHPDELEKKDETTRMLIEAWQKQGLMGVEVYHPSWLKRGYPRLDAMVRRMGLLVTGGSDYHCDDNRHGQPGGTCAYWSHAAEDADALLAAMENQARITT